MKLLKLIKIVSGHYENLDGNIIIRKVKSQRTYRPSEYVWEININGLTRAMKHDTKREAVEKVHRILMKEKENGTRMSNR